MQLPLELELNMSWRRDQLSREAEAERLARATTIAQPSWRARVSSALYALAMRVDPCVTIPSVDRARVEPRSA